MTKHKHKLIGQWCSKCEKYIGKIVKEKQKKPISVEDYLR